MSSLLVVGFFGVGAGHRVSQQKPGSKKIYHCFYSTSLPATLDVDERYAAEIRVYSPYNDMVLPDNTVVFLVAKAFFALHETILLEATTFVPVPGDPSDASYDNNVPDLTTPLVIGLGVVPARFDVLADGKSKTCTVVSSDYVRDVIKQSSIQCFFDDSRGRWSKTPMPNINSTVQFYGTFAGHDGGLFRVCVESVALNVGHLEISPSTSIPSSNIKRKWAAFASPMDVVPSAPSDAGPSTLQLPSVVTSDIEASRNEDAVVLEQNVKSFSDSQLSVPLLQEGLGVELLNEPPASHSIDSVTVTERHSMGSESAPSLPSVMPGPVDPQHTATTVEVLQQSSALHTQSPLPGLTIPPSMYSFLANYALMAGQPASSTQPVSFGSPQVSTLEPSPSVTGSVDSQGRLTEPKSKGKRKARRG